jgi:PAS domain S-box-containing protein
MTDEKGWIYWYNKRWYDYTGTTLEEMEGWGWQKVHHPDHVKRVVDKISQHFQTGEDWEDTFPLLGKDGTYRWFLSRATPIRDENSKVLRWFGTNTDITERLQLEQRRDEFIGIASHELKTPVTSLKAYGQVLQAIFKRSGDLKAVEQLGKMDVQINKLTGLIGDLLNVTKIQEGKLQFQSEDFDFNLLVSETIEEIERTTDQHIVIMELGPTKTVYGDRERIGQVLTNLLTNAIKYSPQADKIVVRTTSDNLQITFSVQDFGIGIPQDKQAHIFERFYRVTGDNQETYPGLGLGLYISSEIITRQNGRIWVESTVGKGSTFSFSLPAQPSKIL